MNTRKLTGCLVGCDLEDFLRLVNDRVFFWPTERRLLTMYKAYEHETQTILAVDTHTLVARRADRIGLSAINSGSTAYAARPRGMHTFMPFSEFPFNERRYGSPGKAGAIAEVTVTRGVPEIDEVVTSVAHWHPDGTQEIIVER